MSSIRWFSVSEYESFIRDHTVPSVGYMGAYFGCSLTSIADLLEKPHQIVPLDGIGDMYIWIGLLGAWPFMLYQSLEYPDRSWLELPHELRLDPVTALKFVINIHTDILPHLNWITNQEQAWGIFWVDVDASVVYCPMSGLSKEQALAIQDLLKQQPIIKYPVIVAMFEGFHVFEPFYQKNGLKNLNTSSSITFKLLSTHPNAEINKHHPRLPKSPRWALMRQDDNNNIFHIQDFDYHIDALIAQMDYENRGHKQLYFVEPIAQSNL